MAEKKAKEKLYTVPLRKAFNKSKFSRAGNTVSIIRNYVKKHSKVNSIKIGKHLNEEIWKNGRKSIPRKIRVNVSKANNIGYVELAGFEFERQGVDEVEAGGMKEKLTQRLGGKAMQKQAQEELIEEGKAPTKQAVEKEIEEETKGEKEKKEKKTEEVKKEKTEKGTKKEKSKVNGKEAKQKAEKSEKKEKPKQKKEKSKPKSKKQ